MKKMLAIAAVAAFASMAIAETVYVDDDFESYADTADMQTVWGSDGFGYLDQSFAFSGTQSFRHDAASGEATDNTIELGADVIPTDAEPVVLRGVIYDDGVGNKRFSIGVRSLNTFPLFEMGMYNAVTGVQYYTRMTFFPGLNPSWEPMPGDLAAVEGWHTWEATFTGSDITVTLDLTSDGTIDSTRNAVLGGVYGDGLGQIRLGGPSNLWSAGGGANIDDVYFAQVPEPATLLVLALGALALRRR